MKIIDIDRKKKTVRLRVEDEEDLWLLRTVLREGDTVTAKTTRDVKVSDTGESVRKPMVLSITVKSSEFQPFSGNLRIKGIVVMGPEKYGLKGSWHTLSVKPGDEIVVEKENGWSDIDLKRVDRKSYTGKALIAAIDYDEYGIAILGIQGLKLLEESEIYLPGKDDPGREQALEKTLSNLAARIVELSSQHKADTIIIVGPGFLKNMLADRVFSLVPGKKVITDDTSMGGRKGIEEAVRREKVYNALKEIEIVKAEQILEEFYRLLNKDPDMVAYTLPDVLPAAELGAIKTLVILDELLYDPDPDVRELVDKLLRNAENYRAETIIVPRNTPAGERILPLGGVIAILRYSLPRSTREELGSDQGKTG